ncbi:hypothetical protein OUZ56_002029 [Daphnia magna]|uniref:Uncharacterized protein n=1 Tax=Daphnia magna TaxID=35525 RepID=A0ABR0A4Y5_9CRUS|nr:hypothetical protein OUZ56_002029 [Daphnia magna]
MQEERRADEEEEEEEGMNTKIPTRKRRTVKTLGLWWAENWRFDFQGHDTSYSIKMVSHRERKNNKTA